MPGWLVHRRWAIRFGISPAVADTINVLIDNRLPHDSGRKRASDDYIMREMIISQFGYEGYAAYLLHHVLDYIADRIKKTGEIPTIEQVRRKFSRMLPIGRPYLTPHGLGITRWGVFNIDDMSMTMFHEVLNFIEKHFDEIVEDILSSAP